MGDLLDSVITGAFLSGSAMVAWTLLPLLAQLLGIRMTRYRMPVVPREDLFVSRDPLSPDIFTELQRLGFEPLGMLWTIRWFSGPYLVWPIQSRVFCSSEGCFAEIYRLARGEEPRIVYSTCFNDGALVQTFNYGMCPKKETADFVSQFVVTLDLGEQLDKHLEAVRRLTPGRAPVDSRRLETLVAAQRASARHYPNTNRLVPLYLLWKYAPAALCGLMILLTVDGLSTHALGEPFRVHPSTLAMAIFATGVGLLAIRRSFIGLIALQRKHEVAQGTATGAAP